MRIGDIKNMVFQNGVKKINHLTYADDTIIFIFANKVLLETVMTVLKRVLIYF